MKLIGQGKNGRLTVRERAAFLEVIEQSLAIDSREQFCCWSNTQLQRIFPHGMLKCGMGRIGKKGINIRHSMSNNFPQECLASLQGAGITSTSPIAARWIKTRQPILFEPEHGSGISARQAVWLENFHRFGLTNIAAHGQCDFDSQSASYFSFSRIPGPLTAHHAYLLKLLVPHLHVTLARVVANSHMREPRPPQPNAAPNLTSREMEILEWVGKGNTNLEIADELGISESTVKNHVHHILARLKAHSRTQAVTKAISLKLIHTKMLLFGYTGLLLQSLIFLSDDCGALI